jgi:hypothetical protein
MLFVRGLVVYAVTFMFLSGPVFGQDLQSGNFSSRSHAKACAGSIAEAKRACAPGLTHHDEIKCDCTLDKKQSPEWKCVGRVSCK